MMRSVLTFQEGTGQYGVQEVLFATVGPISDLNPKILKLGPGSRPDVDSRGTTAFDLGSHWPDRRVQQDIVRYRRRPTGFSALFAVYRMGIHVGSHHALGCSIVQQ